MICIISGQPTMNKWHNLPITKDQIYIARLERDEENQKRLDDARKAATVAAGVTMFKYPVLQTTRDILVEKYNARQKSLAKHLQKAMAKVKEKTKFNKFV